jgi:hypothetical protein
MQILIKHMQTEEGQALNAAHPNISTALSALWCLPLGIEFCGQYIYLALYKRRLLHVIEGRI